MVTDQKQYTTIKGVEYENLAKWGCPHHGTVYLFIFSFAEESELWIQYINQEI